MHGNNTRKLPVSQTSKMSCFSFYLLCFFFYKIGEQEGGTGSSWKVEEQFPLVGGEM
jgi:hypothetical protein